MRSDTMTGQWIFVLLSLVGELVLGSIFPDTQDSSKLPQQQVNWKLENLATIPALVPVVKEGGEEVRLSVRDNHSELQTREYNPESGHKATEVPQKIIVVNTAEQTSSGGIVTINNSEMETKEKLPIEVVP